MQRHDETGDIKGNARLYREVEKNLARWVETGLIKPSEGSAGQVEAGPELAKRDIRVAKAPFK